MVTTNPPTSTDYTSLQAQLERDLYLLLEHLPQDKVLDTMSTFGAIRPYQGQPVFHLKPDPAFESQYAAISREPLYPHLDKYEWDNPPGLVGFYCIQPDQFGKGLTCICDMRPFLEHLNDRDRLWLSTQTYHFRQDQGLTSAGLLNACLRPILDTNVKGEVILRNSINYTQYADDDPVLPQFHTNLQAYFEEHHLPFYLQPGQLLIIKNTLLLHARTRIADPNRHLLRIYAD